MPQAKQQTTCFHCGEDCVDETIHFEEHTFCCHGCKTVYSLLKDSGLTTYYDIENTPGKTIKKDQSSFDFLDIDEVKSKFIDFTEGSQNKVTFYLPTMHCAACIWLLEKLEQLNKGVIRSEVNFLRKELTVIFDTDQVSLKELVILLEDLGYPPDLQRDRNKTGRSPEQKKALLKLGVAGFAFGNIMLFSFPEYLSLDDASLEMFKPIFSYLNFALALPVLFYSDTEYLKSAWKSIKLRYLTIDVPIALGIITLFSRSAFEIITQTGPGYFDSFAGLIFFLLVGKWYQNKTYDALSFDRDFKSYFPIAVTRIKKETEEVCLLEDIKLGDRIKLINNQVIPADAVLLTPETTIDYSFVSGESDLVKKQEGALLYAGGRVSGAPIEIEVVKEVSQGYLTSLWNQSYNSPIAEDKKFSGLIDRVSRTFSIGILSIAFITLIGWILIDASVAINAFTAVLIIACPCALALSMPFTSGNVSRILGKMGFFVKNANTLEQIAAIDTIVFDKTGTLTKGSQHNLKFNGSVLNPEEWSLIKSVASNSSHPLSQAIAKGISAQSLPIANFTEEAGKGVSALVKDRIVKIGSASFCGSKESVESKKSVVFVSIDHIALGYFEIAKKTREGVQSMIPKLQTFAYTYLLSGDNESEKEEMQSLFGLQTELKFNQSPQNKLTFIESLQKEGKTVMMLGDGLNDAGALKAANVGVAVADDVFSFSPACDAILQANILKDLSQIFKYVRNSMNIVKASIVLSLLYNIVGLYFAVQGDLTPIVAAILMPLSSISVVSMVTLLTNLTKPKVS